MTLSIIALLHGSPDYLEEFYTRVSTAAWILAGEDYELIIFHDEPGEPAPAIVNALTPQDGHLALLKPQDSRGGNGIMSALKKAAGEKIFIIEVNPREDPEWLLAFSAAMDDNNLDMIYAVREKQPRSWFESLRATISRLFGKCLGGAEQLSAAMFTPRFRDAILRAQLPDIFTRRPLALDGFQQQPFSVIVNERESGES